MVTKLPKNPGLGPLNPPGCAGHMSNAPPRAPSAFATTLSSWRVLSIALLSVSSGLPLGFVYKAMPQWMTVSGVDIKTIGLMALVQAPYVLKVLWAPLLDRYPLPFLGRKRGWVLATQLGLAALMGVIAWHAQSPVVSVVAALSLAFAFTSATHDIAIDGYAVEMLRKEEHAPASGARVTFYRVAYWLSGNVVISLGPEIGWPMTLLGVGLLFIALAPVTIFAPEPATSPPPVPSLKEALWLPFVGFLSRHRAIEIAAFLFFYKFGDNLAEALVSPFLAKIGYSAWDIGVGRGVVTLVAISVGTIAGGYLSDRWGIGRALWIFGFIQALTNIGYVALAQLPVSRPALYTATFIENFAMGLGGGAFAILNMRLTERRFSSTQFALLSSVWGLGRVLTGPPAGAMADGLGWTAFFLLTIPAAIPGLVLLSRFAPWSVPNPDFEVPERPPAPAQPYGRAVLLQAGVIAGVGGTALAALSLAVLSAIKLARSTPVVDAKIFSWYLGLAGERLVNPSSAAGAIDLIIAFVFGAFAAVAVAAGMYARGKRTE